MTDTIRRRLRRADARAAVAVHREPTLSDYGRWSAYLLGLSYRQARLDDRDRVEPRPPVAARASTKPADVWGAALLAWPPVTAGDLLMPALHVLLAVAFVACGVTWWRVWRADRTDR